MSIYQRKKPTTVVNVVVLLDDVEIDKKIAVENGFVSQRSGRPNLSKMYRMLRWYYSTLPKEKQSEIAEAYFEKFD